MLFNTSTYLAKERCAILYPKTTTCATPTLKNNHLCYLIPRKRSCATDTCTINEKKSVLFDTRTICVCCRSTARCRGVCRLTFCMSMLALPCNSQHPLLSHTSVDHFNIHCFVTLHHHLLLSHTLSPTAPLHFITTS